MIDLDFLNYFWHEIHIKYPNDYDFHKVSKEIIESYQPERSKREDYVLYLTCPLCKETDLYFKSKAKD